MPGRVVVVDLPQEASLGRFLFIRYVEPVGWCEFCDERAIVGVFDGDESALLCLSHARTYVEEVWKDLTEPTP